MVAILALLPVACGGEGESDLAAGEVQARGADATKADGDTERVKLWFLAGEQFHPVEREVTTEGESVGPLEATRALLAGPKPEDQKAHESLDTEIPPGTRVEEVRVDEAGEAVVELSPRFLRGVPTQHEKRSGPEKELLNARVSQVVHTVTQFAGISSAQVRSGGVAIAAEQSRSDFKEPKKKPKATKPKPGALAPGTRKLQEGLVRLRYLPSGSADGIFGYQTQQAVMAFQAWQGLQVDGIAGPATQAELAVAKRPRPTKDKPKRRIEVYLDRGVVLLVRGNRTQRAIHASPGKPSTPTPTGRYSVFRKELMSWSVPFSVWLPFASYFNQGIAFHESSDVPADGASAGCVRIPAPEAEKVYDFARLGTEVLVLP